MRGPGTRGAVLDRQASNRHETVPVTVVDAGIGNLGNLRRALERVGGAVEVTSDPAAVRASDRLVLPGVGAFRPARQRVAGRLESALRSAVDRGSHLLGICVGFQLLFEGSEEGGETEGLGLVPGFVRRLPDDVPVPHIGWNRVRRESPNPLAETLDGEAFYFVHGYAPDDVPRESVSASVLHGRRFAAVAGRGRVVGTQFHPERSGTAGLAFLRRFLEADGGPAPGD